MMDNVDNLTRRFLQGFSQFLADPYLQARPEKIPELFKTYDLVPLIMNAIRTMKSINPNSVKEEDLVKLQEYLQTISMNYGNLKENIKNILSIGYSVDINNAMTSQFNPVESALRALLLQFTQTIGAIKPNRPQIFGSGLPKRYY